MNQFDDKDGSRQRAAHALRQQFYLNEVAAEFKPFRKPRCLISGSDANENVILRHMKKRWTKTEYVNITEQFRFCINFFIVEYDKQWERIFEEEKSLESI